MSDEEIRASERLASTGDVVALLRLVAARRRFSSDVLVQAECDEILARAAEDERGVVTHADWIESSLRDRVLALSGRSRLGRGQPAQIAAIAARLALSGEGAGRELLPYLPLTAARIEADERSAAEREVKRLQWIEAEAARTPRALGWGDVTAARDRAEGTGSLRSLSLGDLVAVVAGARESGYDTVEADHEVARSYDYPVTYTMAVANRVASGDVLLTITRRTSRGRVIRNATIVVPADLPADA